MFLDNYPKGFDIDNFEDDLFMIERVPFTAFYLGARIVAIVWIHAYK